MSVQVSTRIDEETKRKFDEICDAIGVSPSNALSIFIKGVINHNGIPFSAVAPASNNMKKQTGPTSVDNSVRPPFEYGSMSGKIWMADDFNEPLDDFREYME